MANRQSKQRYASKSHAYTLHTTWKTKYENIVPPHFKIVPLPNEITSWLTSLLLRLPPKQELVETSMRTTLGRGHDKTHTATASDSSQIISSTGSPVKTKSQSWELSPWLYVKEDFRDRVMAPWLKSQSKIPLMQWLRPSEKMEEKIPTEMQSTKLADFYNGK